jgi:hypothetical protein
MWSASSAVKLECLKLTESIQAFYTLRAYRNELRLVLWQGGAGWVWRIFARHANGMASGQGRVGFGGRQSNVANKN